MNAQLAHDSDTSVTDLPRSTGSRRWGGNWVALGLGGGGIPVLTLHPVPAHWAEEVGVETEGLVHVPEDLADVPDL